MKKRTKIINGLFLSTIALSSITALSIVSFDNQNKISNYNVNTNNHNLSSKVNENQSTYITASERSTFVAAKNQLPTDVVNSLTVKSEYVSNDAQKVWFKPSDNALRFVEVINPSVEWNSKEDMAVCVDAADDWSGSLRLEFVLLKNYSIGGVPITPPGGNGILPSSPYHIDVGYMNSFTVIIPMLTILGLIALIILIGGIGSAVIIRKNSVAKSQDNAKENGVVTASKKPKSRENENKKKTKPVKQDKKSLEETI